MGLPARQRRLEADAEKRPHVARLAEEERRAEQQPDLHAVRVAELEAREHRERAPRRSLRKRGTRPEVAGALDGEIHADLALARLGAEVGEREQPGVAAQGQFEHEPACPANDRGLDRKSTRLNSSHSSISYAVFCLKKKKTKITKTRKRL